MCPGEPKCSDKVRGLWPRKLQKDPQSPWVPSVTGMSFYKCSGREQAKPNLQDVSISSLISSVWERVEIPRICTELHCLYGEGNGNPLQYFAWRIPWTEEPGGLQSTGSQRVSHDWATFTLHCLQKGLQSIISLLSSFDSWNPVCQTHSRNSSVLSPVQTGPRCPASQAKPGRNQVPL